MPSPDLTAPAPGGFLEFCTSTATRPRPAGVLPAGRGPFLFPAPYGTQGVRVTLPSDGPILPTGYSYWSAINAHAGKPYLLVLLGTDRNRGGAGPCLWAVDKATGEVTPLGPLFEPEHPLSWATAEGWYWSRTDPEVLYVSTLTTLSRLHVITGVLETVADLPTSPWPTALAWQWHSSADDRVHSASRKHATTYQVDGALVYTEGATRPWVGYDAVGAMDECHVDASGAWLLVKDNVDGQDGEDNRIIRLATGDERRLLDREGAAGHSDNGFAYMVAADNWHPLPNALRLWMFDEAQAPQGRVVYHSSTWDIEATHVGHGNARPGSPDGQWVLGSGATRATGPRANELVGVPLDGSLRVLIVAPTLVDLDAAGGGDDYGKLPKANVDALGEWALWTTNAGTDRLDAVLVRIPAHVLGRPSLPERPPRPEAPPTWRLEGWGPPPRLTDLRGEG